VLWFWIVEGLALVLATAALWGDRARADAIGGTLAQVADMEPPPATVIVPVRAGDSALREKLMTLRAQDYPHYELLAVAARADQIPPGALPERITVVLDGEAGPDATITELVLAAVRSARRNSQILTFTTGEGFHPRLWLRALVAPLAAEEVGASTAARWYLPEPPDFWSLVRSIWNAPGAGLFGPGLAPWSAYGTLAIRKDFFFEAGVPELWKETKDCDRGLMAALHAAGQKILLAPGALTGSRNRVGVGEFFRAARAQMMEARATQPRVWWVLAAFFAVQCVAMVAAIAASLAGSRIAEWALVALWGLTMLKGTNYATMARAQLPEQKVWFERHGWVHALWVPLAMWIWLAVLIFSLGPRNKRL
jgi:hypothetical protein